MSQANHIARAMYESLSAGEDWPLPSQAIADLNTEIAYEIQSEFVAQRLQGDSVAGFKAGATAQSAQQAFGLDGPFFGVLLASGSRTDGAVIAAADFGNLLLETELCFRVGVEIKERIDDVGALRAFVDGCFPAIELADAGGYGAAKFTGDDLIAGNGASAAYMLGDPIDWRSPDLDRMPVTFSRDGQVLHEAISGEIMGGQWQALMWLVNATLDLGYQVQAGHLFLSGALGRPHPGQPGRYLADYGAFGRIDFEVV